jgi:hypothetical protein
LVTRKKHESAWIGSIRDNDRKDRTNLLSDKGSASDEMAKKYYTAWGKGHLLIIMELSSPHTVRCERRNQKLWKNRADASRMVGSIQEVKLKK